MKLARIAIIATSIWLAGCAAINAPGDESGEAAKPLQSGDIASVPVAELKSGGVAPLAAPTDIWDRIRRGFAIPDLQGDLVHEHEQRLLNQPDYLGRMTERSRRYLFHIVEQLELRDMPTELALLPYIESAFNPQALSSAKAAGLWQFIPSTGSFFDLRQNALRDDRRNVLASTRAALDYLEQLHEQFGDWQLALAAYNWGPGNVQKAIASNQAAGLGTRYADLRMPAETRHYFPKLQAIENLVTSPDVLGIQLPHIGNHPFFDTVEITQDIDVETAARLAGISTADFKALNPSQRKPIIFAAGTPEILLPWDNIAPFTKNLAQADPDTLASWITWVAPKTMSAGEAAQQVGMSEAELREINGIPRRVRIKQGSTLLVARANGAPAAADPHVVNNAQVAYAPEAALKRTVVRARRGDTIASVAQRYDLPAATVARWNKARTTTRLANGRAVVVYLPAGSQARAAASTGATRGKASTKRRVGAPAKPARTQAAKTAPATKVAGKRAK